MEIEEVKTWQWVLAGLIAGALFSCVYTWSGPGFDTQPRDTVEQGEFENDCMIQTKFGHLTGRMAVWLEQYHKDQPLVRDVTVHPPIPSDPNVYWVTGRFYSILLKPNDESKPMGASKVYGEWKLFKYPAPVPYQPGYTRRDEKKLDKNAASKKNVELAQLKTALGGESAFPTVVDYLKAVKGLPDNQLKYQFAWWELPAAKWSLPPLAGLLIIGIAWPMTLSTLQIAGLAKPTPVKAKPKAVTTPQRPAMPAGVIVKPQIPEPPPKPAEEEKEYGGVYYPVVKTHKK